MKKLFLAAWLVFATFAQAKEVALCAPFEKQANALKGRKFTLEELTSVAGQMGSGKVDAEIGVMLVCGIGIDKDLVKGLELLETAAEAGDRESMLFLYAYYSGLDGAAADEAKAMHWLQVGAKHGDARMQLQLSQRYMEGRGVGKDPVLAKHWYDRGLATSQAFISVAAGAAEFEKKNYALALQWFNRGVAADREEGLRSMKLLAQASPAGQYAMGLFYMQGGSVPTDLEEAFKWYRLSAEAGFAPAQEELAYAYEWGRGVPKNMEETKFWREKAADGGEQAAQERWERAYGNKPWEKEQRARYEALREATKDGSAKSKMAIAYFLARTNSKEAIDWLQKATDQGSSEAEYKLGIIYWYGQLGTSDSAEGLKLIRRAASQGYSDAVVWLARAYHQGTDLPANLVAAYALHFLAVPDQADAAQRLESYKPPFDEAMSSEELTRARQLALDMGKPGNFLAALDGAVTSGEVR
ncbi:tetratricopeptide repeat protein [Rhodoferax saidenbachensis]|uniref:TPR repeat protein n=1 Tax=Rhodoferax saidenbachensis TaxID=1484693 RepID=A0ABU1ZTP9_9BURK|nr:tetratricopeptide repeat protein [Rhodoferax saidenbachensis]MDR7308924.1 TPR repeat protein [Rhodoferax saidenbachensis]